MGMRLENCIPNSWETTNPGWYEVHIRLENLNMANFAKQFEPIIEWLYTRIDNPERHARWSVVQHGMSFRFRHERDYILFKLTWL
jgi:hypothetical protein